VNPSRTYGKGTGEDIREGYEPTESNNNGAADEFVVGEDEDESREESEEARNWRQAKEAEVQLKPKYGLEGEAFENVWNGGEPSEAPEENP
jgi:hypothetical protein